MVMCNPLFGAEDILVTVIPKRTEYPDTSLTEDLQQNKLSQLHWICSILRHGWIWSNPPLNWGYICSTSSCANLKVGLKFVSWKLFLLILKITIKRQLVKFSNNRGRSFRPQLFTLPESTKTVYSFFTFWKNFKGKKDSSSWMLFDIGLLYAKCKMYFLTSAHKLSSFVDWINEELMLF